MSILIIFILLLISLVLLFYNKIRSGKVILSLIFFIFVLIGCGILPHFLLTNLQTTNIDPTVHFGKKTAIILLGFGALKIPKTDIAIPMPLSHSRIDSAVSLYHACKHEKNECTLIITGGDPDKTGQSEAAIYQEIVTQLQVNKDDIILESKSNNTFENAKFTNEIIKQRNFDTIYLVTSGFHTKRANLYFSHFGIKSIPYPSDYLKAKLSLLPTAFNFIISDLAIHEYIGILRYDIYSYFKLNKD